MKKLFALITLLAVTSLPCFAKTFSFPNQGDALFKISIPNNWEPDQDDDEILEATSPDEHIRLSIWEIKSLEEAKNVRKDVVAQLKDHATKIKLDGGAEELRLGGMECLLMKGTAVDKESGEPIKFRAVLVTVETRAAIVFFEADAETPQAEVDKLVEILDSIKPVGTKK